MDGLDYKVKALSERLERGVTRESLQQFYDDYDLQGEKQKVLDEFEYVVLDPDQGKEYDSEIETYSFLLKRRGKTVVFQPHGFGEEGLTPFVDAASAEEAAKLQIDSYATQESYLKRDADFARSME